MAKIYCSIKYSRLIIAVPFLQNSSNLSALSYHCVEIGAGQGTYWAVLAASVAAMHCVAQIAPCDQWDRHKTLGFISSLQALRLPRSGDADIRTYNINELSQWRCTLKRKTLPRWNWMSKLCRANINYELKCSTLRWATWRSFWR